MQAATSITQERISSAKPFVIFSAAILGFIAVLILTGRIPDFFRGEAFYEFHWTETEPFLDALRLHYQENGRFFSWLYTEGWYELIGYQPAVFHILAILLNYFAVVAGATAIFRLWPKQFYKRYLVILFGLVAFFIPYSTNWFVFFASDHYYLAILIYFISVLLIQQWALSALKPIYLILGVITFLIALFTYEHVAFLFPVALMLSYPLVPETRRTKRFQILIVLLGLASLLWVIVPLAMYQGMKADLGGDFVHPAFAYGFALDQIPQRVIQSASYMVSYIVNSAASLSAVRFLDPAVFLLFGGLALWEARVLWRDKKGSTLNQDVLTRLRFLFLSALFFIAMGIFPYAAWGSLAIPHSRFYAVPLYGLAILIVLAISLTRRKIFRILIVLGCFALICLGLYEYERVSNEYLEWEFRPTENYLSLVEIVPRVRPNTTFIFVDYPLGNNSWNGCALALRVLYGVQGIRCAHLSTTDEDYGAVWSREGLFANEGGLFSNENWILVGGATDGSRYIVPELRPGSDVLIDWVSTVPISTDYRRIVDDQGPPDSDMYFHLLKRWEGRR